VVKMRKVNQTDYCITIAHLIDFPSTAHELADLTALNLVTVQDLLNRFKEHKIAHIVGWEADRFDRDCTPIYKFGKGPNKPRRSKTRAQIAKNYRERKRIREISRALVQVAV
jgi:hypothetical protein